VQAAQVEPVRPFEVQFRLRDCSIGDCETYLEVRPMRIARCGGTRVERLPVAAVAAMA
jgi:hypothetical protein